MSLTRNISLNVSHVSAILLIVGPLQRVRPRNGILCLVVVVVLVVVVPLIGLSS